MRLRWVAKLLLVTCVLVGHGVQAQSSTAGWQLRTSDAPSPNTLTLTLLAQQALAGWLQSGRPVLIIQCSGGTAAAYVETGLALEVTQVDQQIVRVRFDNSEFHSERWREVANWTITPHRPAELIARLLDSQRLVLEFTPFSSAPVQATFAVQGLVQYSRVLAAYCGVRQLVRDTFHENEK